MKLLQVGHLSKLPQLLTIRVGTIQALHLIKLPIGHPLEVHSERRHQSLLPSLPWPSLHVCLTATLLELTLIIATFLATALPLCHLSTVHVTHAAYAFHEALVYLFALLGGCPCWVKGVRLAHCVSCDAMRIPNMPFTPYPQTVWIVLSAPSLSLAWECPCHQRFHMHPPPAQIIATSGPLSLTTTLALITYHCAPQPAAMHEYLLLTCDLH